jgi:hypothetical protein
MRNLVDSQAIKHKGHKSFNREGREHFYMVPLANFACFAVQKRFEQWKPVSYS